MYVTRPLSMYQKDPSALSLPPPEGPNSGVLVIQDEEADQPTCCFGMRKSDQVKALPFPQNKNLVVHLGQIANLVLFIPVLNQPLSSNQYYVIKRDNKHKGKAYTSSKEEDIETCCFCKTMNDLDPIRLDPRNTYQQFEVQHEGSYSFFAKSRASDGIPPTILRTKWWAVSRSTPSKFNLNEAPGLDTTLRARLPDFNFPLTQRSSIPVVVGKWYCPFMFIKEGTLKEQMKSSRYYEMILEQQWEQIFSSENNYNEGNVVTVDVVVESEMVAVFGREAMHSDENVVEWVMWFRSFSDRGEETNVGLSLAVVERMKWEQERFGWVGGGKRQVRVKRVEEFGGMGVWRKFGCYVLVERFALKRMDGSLVLTYDFKHTHQIRSKWE